jgi:putative sigma-54 modulation protein
MKIDYVGRHLALDDVVRSHAAEKLGRLTRFLAEPVAAHVTLDAERHRKIAEIHLRHRHGSLHAREENSDLLEAIGQASDHLERQAKRARKRSVDRRRRASREAVRRRHWPVEVLARESLQRGAPPKVIKSSRFEIHPMTLEQAALRLEGTRNGFLIFHDAESDRLSVLYRRHDDDYGLIVPEA